MPDFKLESAAGDVVAGIDEAGRGPWAGPVVAAAALLDHGALGRDLLSGLNDSKALTPARRANLYDMLTANPAVRFGTGLATVEEIDIWNILKATHLAMARAYDALNVEAECVLIDGDRAPALPCVVQTVVKGDSRSLSIAAASIFAKVSRDRMMAELAEMHPGYGWETNKGYGTAEHREALKRLGVTPHHRKSYAPVREALKLVQPSG